MSDHTVPTVAFAFLSPDALRIFLEIKNFRVSVFTGEDSSLNLRENKPDTNIIILPNFAKRGLLVDVIDRIGRLVVLTNGRHEELLDHNIPILDATVADDGQLVPLEDSTPNYYVRKIGEAAVDLVLTAAKKPVRKKPQKAKAPTSLDMWLDKIDTACPDDVVFTQQVEYPICQYLVGQLGQTDFQGAMKALVTAGADKSVVQGFYRWLTNDYADAMAAAMIEHLDLDPKAASQGLPPSALATKHKVAERDIQLLDNIFVEMQTEGEVEQ